MSNDTSHDWTWVNGRTIPAHEPAVAGDDQGLLLGTGLFETIAVVNGNLVNKDAHMQRLLAGLQKIGTPLSTTLLDPEQILKDLFTQQPGRHGALRITVTPGLTGRGLDGASLGEATLLGSFQPLEHLSSHPIDLHISSIRRNPESPSSYIKSINYLDQILALREAKSTGADDALLLTVDGRISCTTTANLLIWDGKQLKCPDQYAAALPGTTLALLSSLLPTKRKIIPAPLTRLDLDVAKGVYLTNSLRGVLPINTIGDRRYHSDLNAVYAEMTKALRHYVIAECGEHVGDGVFPWMGEG